MVNVIFAAGHNYNSANTVYTMHVDPFSHLGTYKYRHVDKYNLVREPDVSAIHILSLNQMWLRYF